MLRHTQYLYKYYQGNVALSKVNGTRCVQQTPDQLPGVRRQNSWYLGPPTNSINTNNLMLLALLLSRHKYVQSVSQVLLLLQGFNTQDQLTQRLFGSSSSFAVFVILFLFASCALPQPSSFCSEWRMSKVVPCSFVLFVVLNFLVIL